MSVMQDLRNGMSVEYNSCNLCGMPISDKKYVKMTVYGRSETRKVHVDCVRKYLAVDNTEIFNSTKVRKNGVINFAKISIKADDITALKAYMVSCGYTYVRANQTTATFISPKFSGCSSVSKLLKIAPNKCSGFEVRNFEIYDVSDMRTEVITMVHGINTDYTEAIRLFNSKKLEKLSELLKEKN